MAMFWRSSILVLLVLSVGSAEGAQPKPPDYYKVLGLKRGANQDDIKKNYKKLARKYHPDVSKDKDSTEKIKKINAAYTTLSDPKKKEDYDLGRMDENGNKKQNSGFGGFNFGGGGGGRRSGGESGFNFGGGGGGRRSGGGSGFNFGGGGFNFNFGGGGGGHRQQQQQRQRTNTGGFNNFRDSFKQKSTHQQQQQQQQHPKPKREYYMSDKSIGDETKTGPMLRKGKDFRDIHHLASLGAEKQHCNGFVLHNNGQHARFVFKLGNLKNKGSSWPLYLYKSGAHQAKPYTPPEVPYKRSRYGYSGGRTSPSALIHGRHWFSFADLAKLAQKAGYDGFVEKNGDARMVKKYEKVAIQDSWPLYELGDDSDSAHVPPAGTVIESTPQIYVKLCIKGEKASPSQKTKHCIIHADEDTPQTRQALEKLATQTKHEAWVIFHPHGLAPHFSKRLLAHLGAPPYVKTYSVMLKKTPKNEITFSYVNELGDTEVKDLLNTFKLAKTSSYPDPW